MKLLTPILFLITLSLFALSSCSDDQVFNDFIAENTKQDEVDDNSGDETPTPAPAPGFDPIGKINQTPCDYTLDSLSANSTLKVGCQLDLGGQTVNLPQGVTLSFDGGEIINGTLKFSGSGKIDGNLLNHTMQVEGEVSLTEDAFQFHTSRWNIVEGKVSDDVAVNNRMTLNKVFKDAASLGAGLIQLDILDAYFHTVPNYLEGEKRPQDSSIQIPTGVHVKMTENTHLRKQPNGYKNTVLMSLFLAENSIVEGGVLHGDRDTHDYSDTSSKHEWGHLVLVKASINSTIQNVTMMDAGGDGVNINALGHAFNADYKPSKGILVKNNKIIRCRRLGISITDGRDIVIDGNELIDTGIATELSEGTAPQWAINIEPIWSDGVKYEIVENVIIKNNIERGSEKGGFINARGSYITYENNMMESTLAMGETTGSIVRNNIFKNPTESSVIAIYAGMNDSRGYGNERGSDNEVYGNEIIGFQKGIFLQDPGIDLHSNILTNCDSGILIKNTRDSKIRNNTITSNKSGSEGIGTHYPEYVNNLVVSDNTIEVKGAPFRLTRLDLAEGTSGTAITIENNEGTSIDKANSVIQLTENFIFQDNVCNDSGIRLIEASNGRVLNNTFNDGVIRISKGCSDINFEGNTVTGGRCFQEDNSDAVNIVRSNNSCN